MATITTNTYTYNDRGQLLTSAGSSGSSQYTWDAEAQLTKRVDAAGTTQFGYNGAGHTTNVVDPQTNNTIAYTYDADNRLTGKNDATTSGRNNTYTYDLTGRLTQWNDGTTATPYTWDPVGNRTSAADETATYDERNRLLTAGTTTYGYTARGSRSTITTPTETKPLTFDAFEQMVQDGGATYTYDAQARMIKRDGQAGFAYDGPTNNLVADGTTKFTRGPGGDLISTGNGTAAQLAITDQHGDVTATLDPTTKTRTSSTTYDPFGQITTQTGPKPGLGYQGAWTDPTTGHVNMASRWYDPTNGGFDSRDTWTLDPTPSGNANRYAYAGGDPLTNTDPTGHFIPVVIAVIGAGARACARSKACRDKAANVVKGGSKKGGKQKPAKRKDRDADEPDFPEQDQGSRTDYFDWGSIGSYCPGSCDMSMGYTPPTSAPTTSAPPSATTPPRTWTPPRTKVPPRSSTPKTTYKPRPRPKAPIKPKPKPHVPTAPKSRPPTPSTPVKDPTLEIIKAVLEGVRALNEVQNAAPQQVDPLSPPNWQIDGETGISDARKGDADYSANTGLYLSEDSAALLHIDSFDDTTSADGCSASKPWVYYQPIDEYDRATGVQACLTSGSIDSFGRKKQVDFGKRTTIIGSDTDRSGSADPPRL
ncbi:RHS repeat-associated core domain-containing protein [Streptomyces sp. SID3343]|uniref:RHS repeat-associated core domain-containing protein n=1 Tax=Streptomyces sp. SID3343 TaxID=2690260 RepID=UPI00136F0521|nr:hypothetical protein [Streptomyces sp. SID3343]